MIPSDLAGSDHAQYQSSPTEAEAAETIRKFVLFIRKQL
jgi:hypothetical protein